MSAVATAPTPDAVLLGLVARGDRPAFERLYERHAGPAHAAALAILRDPGLAEEAVQDAFLSVWRRADRFDPARGTEEAWVLGIVRHRAIDALRRRHTHARRRAPLEVLAPRLEAAERTDAEVERRDGARVVRSALRELPDEQRRTLELAYFAGLSQAQIAARLLVPLGTVKGRMRLGLERLRGSIPEAVA